MPQKITPRFREARVAAQLSLRRAAELIGRTASAVQKWENGTNSPTVADIYRMADAYGVSACSFFVEPQNELTPRPTNWQGSDPTSAVAGCIPWRGAHDEVDALQIEECTEALLLVPPDFAMHWIAALKACAIATTREGSASKLQLRRSRRRSR